MVFHDCKLLKFWCRSWKVLEFWTWPHFQWKTSSPKHDNTFLSLLCAITHELILILLDTYDTTLHLYTKKFPGKSFPGKNTSCWKLYGNNYFHHIHFASHSKILRLIRCSFGMYGDLFVIHPFHFVYHIWKTHPISLYIPDSGMSTSNQFNTQSISDTEEALQQSTNNATSSLSSDCPGKSFHIHVIVFCDVISSYTASITKQSTFPIFNLHKCQKY